MPAVFISHLCQDSEFFPFSDIWSGHFWVPIEGPSSFLRSLHQPKIPGLACVENLPCTAALPFFFPSLPPSVSSPDAPAQRPMFITMCRAVPRSCKGPLLWRPPLRRSVCRWRWLPAIGSRDCPIVTAAGMVRSVIARTIAPGRHRMSSTPPACSIRPFLRRDSVITERADLEIGSLSTRVTGTLFS